MKLSSSVLTPVLLSLVACGSTDITPVEEDPAYQPKSSTTVELRVANVKLTTGPPHRLDVRVLIARPKEGLRETEDGLSADVPIALKPKLMYVSRVGDSSPHTGQMCDRPVVPHGCEFEVTEAELGQTTRRLVKILFEDQAYGASTIEVAPLERLKKPVIRAPVTTPAQNTTLDLVFDDVGADKYTVAVRLCRPYANDGINPCLDETTYAITRNGDGLAVTSSRKDLGPTVQLGSGRVHLVSNQRLIFSEKLNIDIEALKQKKEGEVEFFWFASASKDLDVNVSTTRPKPGG